MIQITIPKTEMWDESRQEFYYVHSCKLTLEHSLVSLSKWESRWEKPFLSKTKKRRGDFGLYPMHDIDSKCGPEGVCMPDR